MRLIVIGGPTASGKTGCAVAYCRACGGEVVSCDSMQVYRGMEILSACATKEEQQGVPHHLLGIAEASEPFSAGSYREAAKKAIEDILSRGRQPVLCGGSGLYIDALTRSMTMGTRSDPAVRQVIEQIAAEAGGKEKLHDMLREVDPCRAEKLHVNDVRRVVRALEIYRVTGETQTSLEIKDREGKGLYDAVIYALDRPREELYRRIDARCVEMFREGLVEEVSQLRRVGGTAGQAIGYKEILPYLDGVITREEALASVQQATRNYAKRQLTWLRRDTRVKWIDASGKNAEELAEEIRKDWEKTNDN